MTKLGVALVLLAALAVARATSHAAGAREVELPPGPVLAFTRADDSLAAAAEDGNSTIRLASPDGGDVTGHDWSPDGRRIVFTRCRGRNCTQGSVYVIRANGSSERMVVSGSSAVWMPDGTHLLVSGADRPGHWIVRASGGGQRRFTAPGLAGAPVSPRISPDGRWLLHLTRPYGRSIPNPYAPHHANARNWLWITDLRTGRSRKASGQPGWYMIGNAPWSPDGGQFTFTRRASLQAPGGQIYVSSPTLPRVRLVAARARGSGAWSPESTRLAFNGESCKIRVVSLDGTSPARTLSYSGCLPTWRPEP